MPNLNMFYIKSINFYKDLFIKEKPKFQKIPTPPVFYFNYVVGFFYGYSVDGYYGGGMLIMIKKDHIFKLWMGSGKGSNTKAEWLGLWEVLS